MKNARAIIRTFGGPAVIDVVEEAGLPQPKPGEVRIRVEASSVLATDTLIRKGIYPLLKDKPPFTLGYDLVGVIYALGKGVSDWQVGQRVADLPQIGGNARYVSRSVTGLLPVPAEVDAAEAVCLVLSGMTAYQMLRQVVPTGELAEGQRMLVQGGSGAVGTFLLQLGRLMGIEMVATASVAKLDQLRAFGATAIDYPAFVSPAETNRYVDHVWYAYAGSGHSEANYRTISTLWLELRPLDADTPVLERVAKQSASSLLRYRRQSTGFPGPLRQGPCSIVFAAPNSTASTAGICPAAFIRGPAGTRTAGKRTGRRAACVGHGTP